MDIEMPANRPIIIGFNHNGEERRLCVNPDGSVVMEWNGQTINLSDLLKEKQQPEQEEQYEL